MKMDTKETLTSREDELAPQIIEMLKSSEIEQSSVMDIEDDDSPRKFKKPRTKRLASDKNYPLMRKPNIEHSPAKPWTATSYIGPVPLKPHGTPLEREYCIDHGCFVLSAHTHTRQELEDYRAQRLSNATAERRKIPPSAPIVDLPMLRSSLTARQYELVCGSFTKKNLQSTLSAEAIRRSRRPVPPRPPPFFKNPHTTIRPASRQRYSTSSTASLMHTDGRGTADLRLALPKPPINYQAIPRITKTGKWGQLISPIEPNPFEKRTASKTGFAGTKPNKRRHWNEKGVAETTAKHEFDTESFLKHLKDWDHLRRATERMTEGVGKLEIEDWRRSMKRVMKEADGDEEEL